MAGDSEAGLGEAAEEAGLWSLGQSRLGKLGIDEESHGEAVLSSAPGITFQQTELSCPGRDHLGK